MLIGKEKNMKKIRKLENSLFNPLNTETEIK